MGFCWFLMHPLACMQDHLLEVLRPGLSERRYRDGEYLIRQGEQSTHLFYMLEGQVEVLLKLPPQRESSSAHNRSAARALAAAAWPTSVTLSP